MDWKVYKDSQELFKLVLKIVKKLPREFRFELGSQLTRSAFSVILNIAESSGKASDKELNRYINIVFIYKIYMKYTKKVIRTAGGLVVRVPSDIVKILSLTENDYVEIDLTKIDLKALKKK